MIWVIIGLGILLFMIRRKESLPGEIERRLSRVESDIIAASHKYRIPTYVLLRIGYVESRFDPEARGLAGEYGMFQIMPGIISAYYGFSPWDAEEVLNPHTNADIAAWLLRDEIDYWRGIDRNKSIEYAVRSYNVGRGRARDSISDPYWSKFQDAGRFFPAF